MTAGGYRPNSGPMPGTKYRPRANKKDKLPKIPKKRGRPPKVKVEVEGNATKVKKIRKVNKIGTIMDIAKDVLADLMPIIPDIKTKIKPIPKIPVIEPIVTPIVSELIPASVLPTSLLPGDIENAAAAVNLTPLDYLLSVMNNPAEDQNIRIRVAGMIAPFIHPKPGERTGKKDEKEEKAKTAFSGKFKAGRSPLSLVK